MITRALAIASLVLNLAIIGALLIAFVAMRRVAGDVADQIDALGRTSISTSVRISQTVPVRVTAPINQRLIVPINQQVPVNASIAVEPDIPVIGKVKLDVPFNGTVPISVSVPVVLSQTLPIDAQVAVNVDVPVSVPLTGTPLKASLDRVVAALRAFAGR